MTSGSGSDPHLLGLLRALRLRAAAPEAAAAGADDAAAALGKTDEGTRDLPSRGLPAGSAGVERAALPPGDVRPGPAAAAPPELPAGPDPVAQPGPAHPGPPPSQPVPRSGARSARSPHPAPEGGAPPATTPPAHPAPLIDLFRRPAAPPPVTGPPGTAPRPTSTPGPGSVNPGALVPRHPATPPARGDVRSGGPVPIEPVRGLSAVGRPVPGQHPEPPHLGIGLPGVPRIDVRPVDPHPAAAPAPPVDGMRPADDAALRDLQRLLGTSLSLAGGPEEVATRLRAALILAQPQLATLLPGGPQSQREQLAGALTWLVHHLDQPPVLVAGCVQLGAALAECRVSPQQLQLAGAALAEAMRTGMAAGGWRPGFDDAWRTTWQHVHEWIGHGAEQSRYEPTTWRAVVVSHERRRPDLAVVRFRPYLPMPFRPGQYARIEVPELPGVWRPYSLAGAPRRDTELELHVRAKTEAGVSGALVYRTVAGDEVRFGRPEGDMGLPTERPHRDLLLVAGDTGVAPLKAMLTELAATGDPRSAVLFWGVRDLDELYDIDEISAIARACRRATVVPVVSEGPAGRYASGLVTDAIAAYGEWSAAEAFVAGPPQMLAATGAALRLLGVAPDRIHHDAPTA